MKPSSEREFKNLGVTEVDPNEYRERFGSSLLTVSQMPKFLQDIVPPAPLAATAAAASSGGTSDRLTTTTNSISSSESFHLEGDLEALKLIDLDQYGLSHYKRELERRGIVNNS